MPAILPVLSVPATARRALVAAVGLGVLGDVLLFDQPAGLNVLAITTAMLAVLGWLARRSGRPMTLGATLLGTLALLFAGAIAWRAAPTLVALDVLALGTVLCALAGAVLYGDALAIEEAGPLTYAGGAARTAARMLIGAPALTLRAADGPSLASATTAARVGTLARGGLLASPVLLVFGLLLTAADPTFARLMSRLVGFDDEVVLEHVLLVGVVAWAAGGYLYAALLAAPVHEGTRLQGSSPLATVGAAVRERLRGAGIGTREVTVAIALVDVLFLGFGALQVGWLFGGADALAVAGLTPAAYARRGFFELVAVAALTLPMLLVAHAVAADAPGEPPAVRRAFRWAARTLVALVLLLLLSAADRMRLYQSAFGLTHARFYASAFMGWLGFVFVWAAVTLQRERAAPFALGTLLSGWAGVLVLHVVNPDARIVAVNAARAAAGHALDVDYLRELSADATPALVRLAAAPPAVTRSPDADRVAPCAIPTAIAAARRAAGREGDWRGWNLSRARAHAALDRATLPDPAATCAPRVARPTP